MSTPERDLAPLSADEIDRPVMGAAASFTCSPADAAVPPPALAR